MCWQGWKDKQTFKGHKAAITALAFNPSGDDTFASASADNTVKVWPWAVLGAGLPYLSGSGS